MQKISRNQYKLLTRWRGDSVFFRKLTNRSKSIIDECITTTEYDIMTKKGLMKIRNLWIEELKERAKWVRLTRKEKNLITNEWLDSTKGFRSEVSLENLGFLIDIIKDGRYPVKEIKRFEGIKDLWEQFDDDELPF